ncbi:hypothetical protein FRACYDRAFT_195706 [Fragilariopsis cylindrus CCMP1102]|uniref:Alpha-ketoglutarate-dependent dioxygenase AlkB-like domain-containing protein n=1 Tax=Fragilariopsis cylindrus CCMP1102 TaxID=635003 RepID=A0A1E7ETH4_9STRA|nr:hypothetical protein FRACYDRAFT_195706 [Fragilariopsis cylindrus CCMP1102]|eukprot:OEU09137.1 hypothetical protein FRACYDRAFT_195706 [Fragilariopsis cylindrus CCMP1102]
MDYPRNENGDYVKHIKGLEYYSNFLTPIEQKDMLDLIYNNTFQEGIIARRQQFYGEMYYHTAFKSKLLQDENSNMMKWLDKTMPYFKEELGPTIEKPTQVLINEYKNNMGIASHFEDINSFGPIICTISLLSPIYMTLKKPIVTIENACDVYEDVVKILLEPGSLLILKSDARYKYRHGIGKYKWITIPTTIPATESISVSGDETGGNENENDDVDQNKNADQSSSPTPLPPNKDDNKDETNPTKSSDNNTNTNTNTKNNNNTTNNNVRSIRRIKRDESYRRVSVTIRHLLSTRRKVYHENEDESNTIKDPNVY